MEPISSKFIKSAVTFATITSHFLLCDVSATFHTEDHVIASSWLILRGDLFKRGGYIFIASEANVYQLIADDDTFNYNFS